MDSYFELYIGGHDDYSVTKQETLEVQAKITFEESFPYKELEDLLNIVDKANPLVRIHILPKALEVAGRMRERFSNSLSEDYLNWVICVHNGIEKLSQYSKEITDNHYMQTLSSNSKTI